MYKRKIKFTASTFKNPIEELRISFNVIKMPGGVATSAEIMIYNLDSNHRQLIEEDGIDISLEAGYEDDGIALVFKGNTNNIAHEYIKPDWITKIFAYNSAFALYNSTINKTLPPKLSADQLADELIKKMEGISKGLTTGLFKETNNNESILYRSLKGKSWSENVKTLWDKLSKNFEFEYAVDNNIIDIVPKYEPGADVIPILINQTSHPQMIGYPERSDKGVNVKTYLYPSAKIFRRFQIESTSEKVNFGNLFFRKVPPIKNEGIYRIDRLEHSGDTHGNLWQTHYFGRNL